MWSIVPHRAARIAAGAAAGGPQSPMAALQRGAPFCPRRRRGLTASRPKARPSCRRHSPSPWLQQRPRQRPCETGARRERRPFWLRGASTTHAPVACWSARPSTSEPSLRRVEAAGPTPVAREPATTCKCGVPRRPPAAPRCAEAAAAQSGHGYKMAGKDLRPDLGRAETGPPNSARRLCLRCVPGCRPRRAGRQSSNLKGTVARLRAAAVRPGQLPAPSGVPARGDSRTHTRQVGTAASAAAF